MGDENTCKSCETLKSQCLLLREEVKILTQKLDNLLNAVFQDKKEFSCQTDISMPELDRLLTNDSHVIKSFGTQTEDIVDSYHNESTINNLSTLSTTQENILLDIFLEANINQDDPHSVSEQQKSYAVPFIMLPYVLLPNKPFSEFQFSSLDSDTVFDLELNNRSVCYYSDQSYSYGNVKHQPNPMPSSEKYICKILNNLHSILPDFRYNSILVTKYANGSQCLGFHSDNEQKIMENTDIVTISFGESRVIKFKTLSSYGAYPDQTLKICHGDIFVMSRDSQNIFQHSVVPDDSLLPRISITLRMLKPDIKTTPSLISSSNPPVTSTGVFNATDTAQLVTSDSYTIYIGDSMFRHLDSSKMSSQSQKALVFSYPGATARSILTYLRHDTKFNSIDPSKVKNVFVFCGTNNVDATLSIPRHSYSNIVEGGLFKVSEDIIDRTKIELTQLVDFLHSWSSFATINFLNILPRESYIRNMVINSFNHHIKQLESSKAFVKMICTELHRSLFTSRDGFRKSDYFSTIGEDNVHLNSDGLIRLARYLKYYVHNN